MIGIDSEWKPIFNPSNEKLSILQLSSETDAFIIDMISLANNEALDSKLTEIFTDERSLSLGFSFENDIEMF